MDKSATLSLDLDNLWTYLRAHGDQRWIEMPTFLDLAAPRITEFFARFDLQPTIFIIGKDLEHASAEQAVSSFHEAGYELANHSYDHQVDFHELDPAVIKDQLTKTQERIFALTQVDTTGFRGPSFQVSSKIAAVLIEMGYRYDASSYPTSIAPLARWYHLQNSKLSAQEKQQQQHLFGTLANGFSSLNPHQWHVGDDSITEVPVSTMPFTRLPIHFTYINFLADKSLVLASGYFQICAAALSINGHDTIFVAPRDRFHRPRRCTVPPFSARHAAQ